jgi:hypothetical protein
MSEIRTQPDPNSDMTAEAPKRPIPMKLGHVDDHPDPVLMISLDAKTAERMGRLMMSDSYHEVAEAIIDAITMIAVRDAIRDA